MGAWLEEKAENSENCDLWGVVEKTAEFEEGKT